MLPYIQISNYTIPSYGLMLLVAFAAALVVALLRSHINNIRKNDTLIAVFMGGIGALLGGKLFSIVQGLPLYLLTIGSTKQTFFDYLSSAGLVYYGSFFGVVFAVWLFSKIYKEPFWAITDTILPSIPLGQAIGRVGCFMAGCCWGVPYSKGCVFSASAIESIPKDIPLLPVQLIESVCALALFIAITIYSRKARKPGRVLGFYLVGYGSIRFVLEFFRYDAIRGHIGFFSVSQWVSIFLIVIGIYFVIRYTHHKSSQSMTVLNEGNNQDKH